MVSGDTVKVRVPGVGVDRNGDPVTVTGITSAPGSAGSRPSAATSSSTRPTRARSARTSSPTPSSTPRAPSPPAPSGSPSSSSASPSRRWRSRTGSPSSRTYGDVRPARQRLHRRRRLGPRRDARRTRGCPPRPGDQPGTVPAPDSADAPPTVIVYRVTNGVDESRATMTLTTAKDYDNPPVVYDAFGGADDSGSVVVDVLEGAYDPDGSSTTSRSPTSTVTRPPGWSTGCIRADRGEAPKVLPFRGARRRRRGRLRVGLHPPDRQRTPLRPARCSSTWTPATASPARSPTTSRRPTATRCASRPVPAPTPPPRARSPSARTATTGSSCPPRPASAARARSRRGHHRHRRQRQRGRDHDRRRCHRDPVDPGAGRATTSRLSTAPPPSSRSRPASTTTSTSPTTARSSPSTPATPRPRLPGEWSQAVDGVDAAAPGLGRARHRSGGRHARAARPC